MGDYLQPTNLDDALGALMDRPWTILAGGTDIYPARVGKPFDEDVLDISRLDALRGITEEEDHFRLGALTSWTELLDADLPPMFDGLKQAAREVGGRGAVLPEGPLAPSQLADATAAVALML